MLTRSLLPFLFPLCVMCTFWLQLSLRFSSLSLAFSNLVLTCLGVVFFMFILRVCCSSLGHALDDFHQIWEILGHSVCPCCSRPHTLGPQGLLEWLTDAALVVVCSCLNFLFLCFVLDNFCCCVFKFIEVFFCIVSSVGNCVQYVCYLVYFYFDLWNFNRGLMSSVSLPVMTTFFPLLECVGHTYGPDSTCSVFIPLSVILGVHLLCWLFPSGCGSYFSPLRTW